MAGINLPMRTLDSLTISWRVDELFGAKKNGEFFPLGGRQPFDLLFYLCE